MQVDDHPAVRRVLRSLREEVGGWQVVGEADTGEAAAWPRPWSGGPGAPSLLARRPAPPARWPIRGRASRFTAEVS